MKKILKQLFCNHQYKHIGTLCGCENCFECTKCGKRITTFFRHQIEALWIKHQIELDFFNRPPNLLQNKKKKF